MGCVNCVHFRGQTCGTECRPTSLPMAHVGPLALPHQHLQGLFKRARSHARNEGFEFLTALLPPASPIWRYRTLSLQQHMYVDTMPTGK